MDASIHVHSRVRESPSSGHETTEKSVGHAIDSVIATTHLADINRIVPVNTGSLGTAQGALIAAPFYVGACGGLMGAISNGAEVGEMAMAGIVPAAIGAIIGVGLAAWFTVWHRRRFSLPIQTRNSNGGRVYLE